jgi:spore germination protein KC
MTQFLYSEGETIFHAIRNAKAQIKSRLYFGHMMAVIISEDLAKKEEITQIADWFMRDAECRETMYFIISQEKSAAIIFEAESVENPILSYEIQSILEKDKKHTLSTHAHELYQIYNILNTGGKSLSLPAIHLLYKDEKPRIEINGTAVFKDRSMVGYLSPDESKYLLFALDEAEGGILTVQVPDAPDTAVSLEIEKNQTSRAFKAAEGKKVIELKLNTDVYIGETTGRYDSLDETQSILVAEAAQKKLEQNIKAVINKLQNEFESDILGFGALLHKQELKQWRELNDDWDKEFKELTVEVISKVKIRNTAMLRK